MALIRWEPAREINTIQQEVNRLFGTLLDSPSGEVPGGRWVPAMDLVEEGDRYVLRADVPGVRESDVKIEIDGGVLTISGERRAEHEQRKEGYYRIERATGRFSRSLTLPEGIDPARVEADYAEGVLEVSIPKPEQRQPHRVELRGSRGATIEGQSPAPGAEEAQPQPAAQTDSTPAAA